METGEGLPDPADVLHETGRTRVTRVFLPGRTVIRKQPLGSDAERRLRHERAMLERLRGIEGVVQLLDEPRYPGSISLADLGGTSLAAVATPLDAEALVRLGSALAGAVAGMHRRGVLHRDITPANVVISRDGTPCLVGFGLATSLAEIRPEFTHYSRDRRHAGLPGAGADRAHRPFGRSAGRPVRAGRDAVRAGDGRAAVRLRRPAAAHPRPPRPGPGAAGRGQRGRAGAAVRDHPAPAGEGAGQPLPDRGRRAPRPAAAAGRPRGSGGGPGAHRSTATSRCGCCRRRGWSAGTPRWRRCRRRSTRRSPGGAGRCWSAARRGWARRR